jgi:cold shock protein
VLEISTIELEPAVCRRLVKVIFPAAPPGNVGLLGAATMSEGTIKRLTDKGFGFIENGSGTDLFFHMSAVEGARFEELREGQKVSYNEGRGPKGPRAENIRVL